MKTKMDLTSVISFTNPLIIIIHTEKINSNYIDAVKQYTNLLNFLCNQYCSRVHFRRLWNNKIKLNDSIFCLAITIAIKCATFFYFRSILLLF